MLFQPKLEDVPNR